MPEFAYSGRVAFINHIAANSQIGDSALWTKRIFTWPNNALSDWQSVNSGGVFSQGGAWRIIFGSNPNGTDQLFDMGIKDQATGSVSVIIDGVRGSIGTVQHKHEFIAPIYVPASIEIFARGQNSTANTGWVNISGYHEPIHEFDLLPYQRAMSYGLDRLTSRGVTVDPGVNSLTYGAWTTICSATDYSAAYLVCLIGNRGNTAMATAFFNYDIAIGAVGAEVPIIKNMLGVSNSVDDGIVPAIFDIQCHIPMGTRIAARAKCGIIDATDRLTDVSLILFG